MPKVGYSEEERERIREALLTTGLDLMAKQGIQHTTVEQIYKAVGISRTFFYTFFPTKEDLVIESLYLQQPKIVSYVRELMSTPGLNWQEAVETFLRACCYGEKSGFAVLTIEEQQLIFRRLSEGSYRVFREKQARLFGDILRGFGIRADQERIHLFINISLTAMIVRRAVPESLPLFVPSAAEQTIDFQIKAIVHWLERMRQEDSLTNDKYH